MAKKTRFSRAVAKKGAAPSSGPDRIILGTRKGTIVLSRAKTGWKAGALAHAGVGVAYAAQDQRSGMFWAALEHGHWGPKLSRSKDGVKWEDAPQIKYPEGTRYIDGYVNEDGSTASAEPDGKEGGKPRRPKLVNAALKKIWVLAFGHASRPGRIYAGTMPGGLFVSEDNGETFKLDMSLWNHPSRGGDVSQGDCLGAKSFWFGGGAGVNGDHTPGIHSIVVDPRQPDRTMIGISCAGVLETSDGGKTWEGRNKGLLATFLPKPDVEWGHDAHFLDICAANPDHVWQQNHCGIFYSADGAKSWKMVSKEGRTAHFGFPICADEKNGATAWVIPGRSDAQRMAIDGSLVVCRTQDGGKTWEELRKGLPQENAYDVVYRHAFDLRGDALAFGSTTGNVYFSTNRGKDWISLGSNFPPIYSVRFA
jgi:photosystem II stability/assembly factor-like uncharacterized protein